MPNHHTNHPPSGPDLTAAARGEVKGLDRTVRWLLDVGADALADDAIHGERWGIWADWCWRTGRDALGASASDVHEWLATDARAHDEEAILAILATITAVHTSAGLDDPTEEPS